jgi:hypothetical protein
VPPTDPAEEEEWRGEAEVGTGPADGPIRSSQLALRSLSLFGSDGSVPSQAAASSRRRRRRRTRRRCGWCPAGAPRGWCSCRPSPGPCLASSHSPSTSGPAAPPSRSSQVSQLARSPRLSSLLSIDPLQFPYLFCWQCTLSLWPPSFVFARKCLERDDTSVEQ